MSPSTTNSGTRGSRMSRAVTVVAAAALCLVGVSALRARLAHAQDITWTAEAVPPEPTEKDKNPPPSIKVRVVGEVAPKQEELANYQLKQNDAKPPLPGVKPSRVVPYHKSAESLAVVVLVEGHEYYFGNDKYKEPAKPNPTCPDCPVEFVAITPGVYDVIKGALDAPQDENEVPTTISHAGPPGSKGALLVYSTEVEARQPMGPLTDLTGDKLGEQERQRGNVTRHLLDGLREAKDQLARTPAARKVLFLISDGVDPGGSAEDFRALRQEFDKEKIEVFPLSLTASSDYISDAKPVRDGGLANLRTLGKTKVAKDGKELAAAIANIVTNEINNRYWLYFPGQVVDAKTHVKSGFTWDEREHELVLRKGEDEFEPRTVLLAPKYGSKAKKSLWWLWLAIPGGLLAIVAAVLLLGGKKEQPAPPPVVQAPPPVVEAPRPMAPVPGGGNKTMAINLSTGDGIPVVGWLVPINGPQAFKTFKLLAGVTKVGNVPGAHIQFDDQFMSAEHAHIVMTPNGFTLMDNNATNGTFINEKRLSGKHELVDNDMVMFGKTSCKFKTIVGLG